AALLRVEAAPLHYSTVDRAHRLLRVALARDRLRAQNLFDAFEVFLRQLYFQRARVLLDVLATLRAGDGHDVAPLRQNPGEGQLRRLALLLRRDLSDALDEPHVLSEVLILKTRKLSAPVVLRQVFRLLEAPRQEAATERAVSDKADPQFPARGEYLRLNVTSP